MCYIYKLHFRSTHHICVFRKGLKQDRQCACNVTLRRVRVSLLPWKSNKYYIFVCVCVCARARALSCVTRTRGCCMCARACILAYPACKGYAPYCDVICDTSRSTIHFSILHHKRHDLKKKVEDKMCLLIFSTIFIRNIYFKNSARYSHKCEKVYM